MKDRDVVVQQHIGFVLKPGQSAKVAVIDVDTGAVIKETKVHHHAWYQKHEHTWNRIYSVAVLVMVLVLAILWLSPNF